MAEAKARRIGVLGSAFNPPHIGHLVLAQEARARLALERVLLVPTGRAPHKELEDDPGAAVRFEMTERASSTGEGLEACDVEVERPGPSYTFETLELLARRFAGSELVWLMGADAAAGLEGWRRPERIAELATLGVADRGAVSRSQVEQVVARVGGGRTRGVRFLEMPQVGVSSSNVRRRVREGLPIRYLVADPVIDLIYAKGLYGG